MKTLPRLLLMVLVLALLVTGGWWYWQHEHAVADTQALTLHGNVDIRQISLAFEGSDRVAEMRVEEGSTVAAGQVVALLDTRTTRLKLEQATAQVGVLQQSLQALRNGSRPEEIGQADAQVSAAQAELERAHLQYERLQATSASTDGRAVARQDIDNARAQWLSAQAQLELRQQARHLAVAGPRKEDVARAEAQLRAAQADQALLQHQLDLAELKAPQAAVVRARLLEPGDMASPQRPAYTLALTDPKWVRAYVREPQLGRIRPGMTATVTTDSAPDQAIAGHIGYISSVAEFTPKTVQTDDVRPDLVYELRVLVEDPQNRLRLGMPATVHVDLNQGGAAGAGAAAGSGTGASAGPGKSGQGH